MRRVACLVIVVGAGCSPGYGETTLGAPSNIMVGSTATGLVTYEQCDDQGASCQSLSIDIDAVTIAPAGVFLLKFQYKDSFQYTALRPGTATLTVEDDDGNVFDRMLTAAVPDYIKVEVDCPSDPSPGTTRAFGPLSEVPVTFEIYAESVSSTYPLFHDASIIPIESPLLTVKDDPMEVEFGWGHQVVFMTGATPATGAITSPYDARVAVPLVVFAPGDATGFLLGLSDSPLPIGSEISVAARLTIGDGELTCMDDFARTARTLTPETCLLRDPHPVMQPQTTLAVTGNNRFNVRGIAAGTCTIEVALDGTPTTHQQSITIAP